jgi:hypothetical protein
MADAYFIFHIIYAVIIGLIHGQRLQTVVLADNIYECMQVFYISLLIVTSYNGQDLDQADKKGLTVADKKRISFIKSWGDVREHGKGKYLFVDGGLFVGILIWLPISISILGASQKPFEKMFPEFGDMAQFISQTLGLSYLAGLLFSMLRWYVNESIYHKLTDIDY